jgi:hypothetical protein
MIQSPANAVTVLSGLAEGTYGFELEVTDDDGAIDKDTVIVIVHPAPNVLPFANAGADQTITLPVNNTLLSGSGADPDGTITMYGWVQVSGPSPASIAMAAAAQTNVGNLVQGIYRFELIVTDDDGGVDKDTVQVTVLPAPNLSPSANAGLDHVITLPVNSVTLTGSGSDPDGTIASWQWTKVAGPASNTIINPSSSQTLVQSLVQGTYRFVLRVTDNSGAFATDTVQVIVNAAPSNGNNIPPVANAGNDITIDLPTNDAQLNGAASDADGSIVSVNWTRISGPVSYSINTPAQLQTAVFNLEEGIYRFELRVADNVGAIARDTVTVTVRPDTRVKSTATLFPNPVPDILNIRIDALTQKNFTHLRIYDARGMLVYQEQFLRMQHVITKQVDVSRLPPGTYLLILNADINTVMSLKFLKE